MLGLYYTAYIDKIIVKFAMQNSTKGLLPFIHGVPMSKKQCPKPFEEERGMKVVLYSSTVGSLMYAMLCTRLDIYYAIGIVSRYQPNPGSENWTVV